MKELKALTRFIKPFKWWIILATLSMVVVTSMSIAGPWAIRSLVDTVEKSVDGSRSIKHVQIITLVVICIYIIRGISRFGTNYLSHYAAWKILENIRSFLYDHLQKLPIKFFKDRQTGDLMSRVIADTRNFEVLLAHAIPTILVNGLMFIGIFCILFYMNVQLALLTLIPIPLLIFMVLKYSKISRPLFREAQDCIGKVNFNALRIAFVCAAIDLPTF